MILSVLEGGLAVLAPAKINLYLEVGPKRPDGFHDIDSIFQAIALHDRLEFTAVSDGTISLEEEGIAEMQRNLVYRAAMKLRESPLVPRGRRLGARIRLTKRIPEGAGLGGGSSDAAATLVALSRLWALDARREDLLPLAAELGSDVPFFLSGGIARCRGRGERVEDWAHLFGGPAPFHYVIIHPGWKVPTKLAYEALDEDRGAGSTLTPPSPLDSIPPAEIRSRMLCGDVFYNRFESVVFKRYPQLESLHKTLSQRPFLKVLMSGSGSALYGVVGTAVEAARIAGDLRETPCPFVCSASSEGPSDSYPAPA
jgi:4-diphosphocytidyl-2-C-methyl-D-erythritol kinase